MLGHASAAMTLDVYSGLFDDLTALADRMEPPLEQRKRSVWAPCGRDHRPGRPSDMKLQANAVGPVGIEPTTRGLKVRCSAS